MPAHSTWNDHQLKVAKALYAYGIPASAIGRRIGKTRGAVIGRMDRDDVSFGWPEKPEARAEAVLTALGLA